MVKFRKGSKTPQKGNCKNGGIAPLFFFTHCFIDIIIGDRVASVHR